MKLVSALLAAAFLVTGCASVRSTLEYPATWPDADVRVGPYQYALWFHPTQPRVLLRRGPPAQLGVALAEGWTVYGADASEPTPIWFAGADGVLQQIGCQADDITGQDQIREVTYRCIEGVDVQREVALRRELWREGVRVDEPSY